MERSVIKLSINHPTGFVPISFYTCHAFPVFDCAEVIDSISMDRKSVSLKVPIRSLQEGDLTVGDKRLHLLMIPGDTIAVKLTDSSKDAKAAYLMHWHLFVKSKGPWFKSKRRSGEN
jgi:hypothetical protein